MYKKTGQSSHYLPRKGSYSTVPHRNGRVDVLPPSARAPLFDIAVQITDANGRLEELRRERDSIKGQLHSLGRVDQLRQKLGSQGSELERSAKLQREIARLESEMKTLRRRSNELKSIVAGGASVSLEGVFMRLARVELPDNQFDILERKAREIVRRAKQ